MSREEMVRIVESFFDKVVKNEVDTLPLDADVVFDSPLISEQRGRDAAVRYMTAVAAAVRGIRVRQHIVEGNNIATLFEEDTDNGPLEVFAKFHVESGLITDMRVYYDPRHLAPTG